MAKRARVATLMLQELKQRSGEQLKEAGDTWKDQVLGFYFPENEDTVDLCVLSVLDTALQEDGTSVPAAVRKNVRDLVNTDTVTNNAISMIFLATAQPVPLKS